MDPDRSRRRSVAASRSSSGSRGGRSPPGASVGFVDVPGHERFVRTMLAGVGPVRLVLFVVAADEGWKPQSEEHLQIVDVLGVDGAVVALTKRDLVDDARSPRREGGPRKLAGTRARRRADRPVSSERGDGIDELVAALDDDDRGGAGAGPTAAPGCSSTVSSRSAAPARSSPARSPAGRSRSARRPSSCPSGPPGADSRAPDARTGDRGRARPVSRVAVNLAGTSRAELRGATCWPGRIVAPDGRVRGVAPTRPRARTIRLTARGAFKVHAGSAERDARVRLYDARRSSAAVPSSGSRSPSRSCSTSVTRSCSVRPAGGRRSPAGSCSTPHRRAGPGRPRRSVSPAGPRRPATTSPRNPRRRAGSRPGTGDAVALTVYPAGVPQAGEWLLRDGLLGSAGTALVEHIGAFHEVRPLEEGRTAGLGSPRRSPRPSAPSPEPRNPRLVDAVLDRLTADGLLNPNEHVDRAPLASTRRPRERPRDPASAVGDRSPSRRSLRRSETWSQKGLASTRLTRPAGPASSCASAPISCSRRRSSSGRKPSWRRPAARGHHRERVPGGSGGPAGSTRCRSWNGSTN